MRSRLVLVGVILLWTALLLAWILLQEGAQTTGPPPPCAAHGTCGARWWVQWAKWLAVWLVGVVVILAGRWRYRRKVVQAAEGA